MTALKPSIVITLIMVSLHSLPATCGSPPPRPYPCQATDVGDGTHAPRRTETPPRASLPVRQAQHPIPETAPQYPPNGYCPKLDGRRSDRACVGAYASWA